jgi:hypothetical protein
VDDQPDILQLLHDHSWLQRALPRAGGFLDQEARFVDAMNVIDAAIAEVRRSTAEDAIARAKFRAQMDEVRRGMRR